MTVLRTDPSRDGSPVLSGVTLTDGRAVDVSLRGDRVGEVAPAGTLAGTGPTLDLAGYLLTPSLVEPHAHLDKALTAELVPNPSYDLGGAVTAWLAHRASLTGEDVRTRAMVALRTYLAHGVTALRTHVDVGETVGLRALEGLLELRDAVSAECEVQVVAFAGEPMTGVAGADNRALLRDALAAGADVAGGCGYRDPDPAGHHQACLTIAAEYGRPVDLHTDETLDPSVLTVRDLAERVLATGFDQPVVASHCVSLGAQPAGVADRVARRMADARLAVVCLPQTNLYLQGRQAPGAPPGTAPGASPGTAPGAPPRALTALRALRAAGVTVAAGGDNLQDPFNCLGRGDPLETAALLVLAGHDRPEVAYAAVTDQARAALGLPPVTVAPGAPAELLAIRATSVRHAIATAAVDRVVVHRGRVVATTTLSRKFPLAGTPVAG